MAAQGNFQAHRCNVLLCGDVPPAAVPQLDITGEGSEGRVDNAQHPALGLLFAFFRGVVAAVTFSLPLDQHIRAACIA